MRRAIVKTEGSLPEGARVWVRMDRWVFVLRFGSQRRRNKASLPLEITVMRAGGRGLSASGIAKAPLARAIEAAAISLVHEPGRVRDALVAQALGDSEQLYVQVAEQAAKMRERPSGPPFAKKLAAEYGVTEDLIYQWAKRGRDAQKGRVK